MSKKTKERPILFSAEMVRAIMDGQKTQTRRVCTPALQKRFKNYHEEWRDLIGLSDGLTTRTFIVTFAGYHGGGDEDLTRASIAESFCPYGAPGDRLWVREAWAALLDDFGKAHPIYKADYSALLENQRTTAWRPSIHMPRRLSRITLKINSVRVECLRDITEEDAKAEGAPEPTGRHGTYPCPWSNSVLGPTSYRETFAKLWDSINKKRGFGWETNPWVWVIDFERVRA